MLNNNTAGDRRFREVLSHRNAGLIGVGSDIDEFELVENIHRAWTDKKANPTHTPWQVVRRPDGQWSR
jgi:hypothetical protein